MPYLWIAFGSALGGMLRHFFSNIIASSNFPFATLVVNIIGSLIIGLCAGAISTETKLIIGPELRLFLMVGFCGGFTTFSSFSLQTLQLIRDGNIIPASLNIFLSVTLCLIFVWLGYLLTSQMQNH